jgi:hypothetical protein
LSAKNVYNVCFLNSLPREQPWQVLCLQFKSRTVPA